MMVDVVIYSVGLENPIEEVEEVLLDAEVLCKAIEDYSKYLRTQGIETFKRDRNMIVTETGYKIAIYADKQQAVVETSIGLN